VLDAYMAHGATLIAAEKSGRKLIGYVGSAREMDRIRNRWTRFVHGPNADWRKKTGTVA
jgi:DNA modification methylase